MDATTVEELKQFIEQCKSSPSILADPSLFFFRDYLESLGAKLPASAHKKSYVVEESDEEMEEKEESQVEPQVEEEEEEIIESDLELEGDTVDPDNDPPQKMGDPSVEVTEECRDASQEAKAKAMEALSQGKLEEAIEHLTEAISLNPTSAIMYATRATVYIKMKKPNAAIRDANAALEINPDSAKGYKSRGMAQAMLGQWEDAAKDLHLASKLDYDEEISAVLKKVEPNAHRIEEHRRKYERLHKERGDRKAERERQRRRAKAQAEYEKAKKQEQSSSSRKPGGIPGGFPGGMPGGFPGAMPGGMPGGFPGAMPGGFFSPPVLCVAGPPDTMDDSPINRLPQDTLHQIFSSLSLRQIMICRSVCKFFNQMLTSPSFVDLISTQPPLRFLALRPPHHHHHHLHHQRQNSHVSSVPYLHVFDPDQNQWLRFSLSFLPFRSPHPVASASGLIYLWGESPTSIESNRSLVVCNPLTRQFQVLPQLGSAWSRHGSVLVDSVNHRVMVLTELAALYFSNTNKTNSWLTFSANLPSKPRSPILISDSVFALCDVGSPWRSQWKLFTCILSKLNNNYNNWVCLERQEWGDIFDIIKRPRLVRGKGNKLLMIGGLKSNFSLNTSCSTILILRLDLERLEWEEAGRMPVDMYRSFQESSKLKVFGGGDRVCFSAKRMRKLALWDDCDGVVWRWIEGVPVGGDGLCRGFVFEAGRTALP